jgi:DMSO/TMAO reductase YedYZ molybdopterin-dependent catalytic subunit
MSSRREFIQTITGAVVAGGAMRAFPALAQGEAPSIPGKEGMIVRSIRFLDLEAPPEYLTSFITPVPHFFVRTHMHEPSALDPAQWKLSIGGEVDKPYSVTLSDLAKLEARTVTNTLECAGNGRAFQRPAVPGGQWGKGAVGTARFSGPRLKALLERAGLKSSAKHVMFRGLDDVPGKVPPFIRSIPIEKALDADTLVATKMNGAPLTRHHGFPARALVPGWLGAASCKWITEIKLLDQPFDGNFMSPGYRMPNQPLKPGEAVKPEDTHSITALMVKSIIAAPTDGATAKSKQIIVRGAAWAGEADITKVEISTDGGDTWHPAALDAEHARYAWRQWSYRWQPAKGGDYVILSRATDSQGRTQPATAAWNPSGYFYNAYDQVKIHVEA